MAYSLDHRGLGTHVHDLTEIMSDGLDIFNHPQSDNSILQGKTIEHHMITAINENNNNVIVITVLLTFLLHTLLYNLKHLFSNPKHHRRLC